jgi:hypothetical protein
MRQRVCNRIEDRPCIAEKTAKAGNVKTFENDTRLQDAMTKLFPATNSQPKPRFAFSRWQSCQLLRTWPLAGDRAASALLMSRREHGIINRSVKGAPSLATQNAVYLLEQLNHFANGDRTNDINVRMRSIARQLTDQEKTALAEYYGAGLGPNVSAW